MERPSLEKLGALVIFAILSMSACARDSEAALRNRLDQWFYLGSTQYFVSNRQCTGALISVNVGHARQSVDVHNDWNAANYAFIDDVMVAVQIAGMSPAQTIEVMQQSKVNNFGQEALSVVALAGSCFEDKVVAANVRDALLRRGALLAFDRESRGLMILDPAFDRLFFVSAEIW